jgi:hypothetical protein
MKAVGNLVLFLLWLVAVVLAGYAVVHAVTNWSDHHYQPSECYFVIDHNGREYPSAGPPYFGDVGVYWDTGHGWGVVMSPSGTRTDKDCLRQRGMAAP